jgi:hypothetical protein
VNALAAKAGTRRRESPDDPGDNRLDGTECLAERQSRTLQIARSPPNGPPAALRFQRRENAAPAPFIEQHNTGRVHTAPGPPRGDECHQHLTLKERRDGRAYYYLIPRSKADGVPQSPEAPAGEELPANIQSAASERHHPGAHSRIHSRMLSLLVPAVDWSSPSDGGRAPDSPAIFVAPRPGSGAPGTWQSDRIVRSRTLHRSPRARPSAGSRCMRRLSRPELSTWVGSCSRCEPAPRVRQA